MKTVTKVWLIAATVLVLSGSIIFIGAMSMLKCDFKKLSTVAYETNNYEVSDNFTSISIDTDTADILFELSHNGKCRVECYEEMKAKHSVTVRENTLVIEVNNNKRWYDYIGIHIGSPKVKVFLPEKEYTSLMINGETNSVAIPKDFSFRDVRISTRTGNVEFYASATENVKITSGTGNICVENVSVGSVELSVSTGKMKAAGVNCEGDAAVSITTGDVYLSDMQCQNLTTIGETSDISLENVVAAGKFSIKTDTGDVEFDRCDAAELSIETGTGDIEGSLLTDKIFVTAASTGDINVPKTTSGGICEIKTETGDIDITIKK